MRKNLLKGIPIATPISILLWTLIIGTLLTVCSCANSRPWTKAEKIAVGFTLTGIVADWYTSERMLDNPNNYEINPTLGKHPSDTRLGIYFPVTSLIILGLSHYYPRLRIPLLSLYGTVSWGYAWHNHRMIE